MKRFYLSKLIIPIVLLLGLNFSVSAQTSFNFTGSVQMYTVPAGVTSVGFDVQGAAGGKDNPNYSTNSRGARVTGTLAVTPGQVLYIYVGGKGADGGACCTYSQGTGGYNGGGLGYYYYCGGGGGASDIRTVNGAPTTTNRPVVAGGGGGAGFYCSGTNQQNGGDGGYPAGGTGLCCGSTNYSSGYNASGGSQIAGGTNTSYGLTGTPGVGGPSYTGYFGGGGGGGYYGGGGSYASGGGGGSSYTDGTRVTGVQHFNGYNSVTSATLGRGLVVIFGPTLTASPTPLTFAPQLIGTTSVPARFFTMNGSYMSTTVPVTITAPTAYTLSLDGLTWTSSLTYTPPSSNFTDKNVYVKFTPTAVTSYCGNIVINGGGLSAPVNIAVCGNGATACAGTPSAGSAVSTPASGNQYTDFSLSLSGYSAEGGLTFQWQSSPNGTTWTNVPGAVLPYYTFTGLTATTYYQCIVTCPTGGSATSTPVTVTLLGLASSSCTPTSVNAYCCNFFVGNPSFPFRLTGDGTSSIVDSYDPASATTIHYRDQTTTHSVNLSAGNSYTPSIGYATNPSSNQIWIDFNNDGAFTPTETVGGQAIWTSGTSTPTITIPANTPPGIYRMRVVVTYNQSNPPGNSTYPTYPQIPPCPSSPVSYADARDYRIVVTRPACSGTPNPGISDASVTSGCANFNSTLFNVGAQTGPGISYQWEISTTSPTSGFSTIGGATNSAYTANLSVPGATVFYRAKTTCNYGPGGASVASAVTYPQTLVNNIPPTPITSSTSTFQVCTGLTLSLGSTPTGGAWSSSDPTLGSVDATSGIVTGVAVGNPVITYTGTNGCPVMQTLTVNQLPAPITGSLVVCQGSSTTLTSASPGGSWNLIPITVASVTPTGGVVTGINGGIGNVTYTLPNTCQISASVTVNSLPAPYITSTRVGTVTSPTASYCTGSFSTIHIITSGSQIGVNYQLMLAGVPVGGLMAGTGSSLDFGVQTAPGTYTVYGTNTTTGCGRLMVSAGVITLNPLPLPQTVGGGGSFCAGGSGVNVGLSGSQIGVDYELYAGSSFVNIIPGTGSPATFGPQTAAGIYTVIARNATTGCVANMTGSATVILNPLPTPFDVTGGGGYCFGGPGSPVNLSHSNTGVSYQLFNGSIPVGSPILGTGSAISFGNQTVSGVYTVEATNNSTGCVNTMNYSAPVNELTLPAPYNVTGGGSYCTGGAGVVVSLDGSDFGDNYQLFMGSTPVGALVAGTGLGFSFPPQTAPGTYTVVAYRSVSGCVNNMMGSATITINSLPNAYSVTGGGNYCLSGGSGRSIGLSSSTPGVSYQLMIGGSTTVGSAINGTGSALDFGAFTTAGAYTVVATNATTGCSRNMTGVANIGVNPPPASFNVTGTGAYCTGSTGRNVGLDFSSTGVSYQLYRNGTAVGSPISGTGTPLNFGLQTIVGSYTVVATNMATTCTANMAGSAVISIDPLPALYIVNGGGNYCAGGAGINVRLNGSELGISYQLYLGLSAVGSPMAGTGTMIDFGNQTAAGSYTIRATNTTTGCVRNMVGTAVVVVNALPGVYTLTGGGIYCAGGTGVRIGLSGSATGVKYQLFNGTSPVGAPLSGSGGALDFGLKAAAGTYTVVATSNGTMCTNTMSGSTVVATNPLPAQYNVTGGGSYCVGGEGHLVGLDGSDPGIDYQLYNGTTMVGAAMPGTGSAIDFGMHTAPGTYTVVATDAVAGCTSNMLSNASITINALPAVYSVLGGGNYCSGGSGVRVYLSLSGIGIQYQLYNGSTPVGSPVSGTASSLDFGVQTAAGSYTVSAMNTATGCANDMAGSATINVNTLPADHTVGGGGSYCVGGTGVHITLDGSDAGVKYQLYMGSASMGSAVTGTGSAVDFGLLTSAGTYTVLATNLSSNCSSNMTGSATVATSSLPAVYPVTGGGSYCATGFGMHIGLSNSQSGVNYQLYRGTAAAGIAVPGTGGVIDMGLHATAGTYTVRATDANGCMSNMSGNAVINVLPVVLPHVNVSSSIAGTVCNGQTVSYAASPVNGGTAPTYQWFVNGVSAGVGSNFSYIPLNGDVVTARIRSNATCAIPDTATYSMVMDVSAPQMPSASVAVNPGAVVCTGSPATFTANTLYGGTTPVLSWIKNGVYVASGTSYTYTPVNGDIVTFMLGSNFNCRLADSVFSTPVSMSVQNTVIPVVAIVANPGANIANGQSVTFTASSANAGPNATYQWLVNSVPVPGATMATFTTSSLNHRDSVTCEVVSVCGLTGFNSVKISVSTTGVSQVTGSADVRLIPNPNKGEFSIKGTLAAQDDEASIEVVNMLGQVVYTGKVSVKGGMINEQVVLSNSLANGMYLLNLRSGSENSVFHFVIEK